MKFISAVTLATPVVLLQNAGLVSALDVRLWPTPNCSGGFLQCGNLPAHVADVADFSVWRTQTCQPPLAFSGNSAECVPINFAQGCVEPDSFGFVDEAGKQHIAKITEVNKKAIYEALEKGDVAALSTEAAAAA
ncbi:hypothetical protein EST38_g9474 [Candolleomyces aberdarensis]|uniref:Uncharacterized protein n=1 Tax=Candolleomyces aberdarensis TaxID=2316362 RepID=A0A4Q2DD30_9AGAR|nr:hypothetical protein EST38_g9474 [Candolleomyces aberdarensis]